MKTILYCSWSSPLPSSLEKVISASGRARQNDNSLHCRVRLDHFVLGLLDFSLVPPPPSPFPHLPLYAPAEIEDLVSFLLASMRPPRSRIPCVPRPPAQQVLRLSKRHSPRFARKKYFTIFLPTRGWRSLEVLRPERDRLKISLLVVAGTFQDYPFLNALRTTRQPVFPYCPHSLYILLTS